MNHSCFVYMLHALLYCPATLSKWFWPTGGCYICNTSTGSFVVNSIDSGLFVLFSRPSNMFVRSWWDWSLIVKTYLPSMLWHCWLGHLTRKIPSSCPRYDLLCVWWDVKPCSISLSIASLSYLFCSVDLQKCAYSNHLISWTAVVAVDFGELYVFSCTSWSDCRLPSNLVNVHLLTVSVCLCWLLAADAFFFRAVCERERVRVSVWLRMSVIIY